MTGRLADVRIVELASPGPDPHEGMSQSDFGADVLRAVRPNASDSEFGGTPTVRGRTSVAAGLKDPADRASEATGSVKSISDTVERWST
jgi:alpha-methylacyl-CoA racemase